MKHSLWLPTVLGAALLAACGGGSDAPAADGPAALSLSGTAATGAAISGKTVDVKCSAGTGSATTGPDGRYTVSIAAGVLPCLLAVTPDGGAPLHSVATGTGGSAVANISPVTQLVIASFAGTDPAAYFAAFDAGTAAALTSGTVEQAVSAVKRTLQSAGIDLGTIDVLAGTLTPATSSTPGNAYDDALEALAAAITSTGTTLAALTTTVAAASPAAAPAAAVAAGTVSLPADMLLKTAAANCPALRSGTYRAVMPAPASTLADQYGSFTLNAATLHLAYADGSASVWTPHATEACRYTDETGMSDLVVSQAGVIVGRSYEGATWRPLLAFPAQSHTLAEMAGTWNVLGVEPNDAGTAYTGASAMVTLGADGAVGDVSVCRDDATWSVATCSPEAGPPSRHAVNSAGGYDVVEADGQVVGRGFAYRAGSGALMHVQVYDSGDFSVWTQRRTNELPPVGRVSTSWDIRLSNTLLATPALLQSTNTITAVDAAAGRFERLAKTVGGTDEHLETVQVNQPRAGYNFRAATTAAGTGGGTVAVTEWTNLGLRGMGVTALTRPAQRQFMFSVQQP